MFTQGIKLTVLHCALLAFTLIPILASAQIYKCVGRDGNLNFTDQKCPDGEGSEVELRVKS